MMKFTILMLLEILIFVNYLGTVQMQENGTHFKKQLDANFTDNNIIENIESRSQSGESLFFWEGLGNSISDDDPGDLKNNSQVEDAENRNQSEESSLFLNESSRLISDEGTQRFPKIIVSDESSSEVLKMYANESMLLISSYTNTGVRENNSEIENAENPNMREEFAISMKESGNMTSDEETGNHKNISEIENVEYRNKHLISDEDTHGFPVIITSGDSHTAKFKIVANESIRLISSYANTGVSKNNSEIENPENPNMREEFTISIKISGNLTSHEETGHHKNISEIENVENRNKSIEFPKFVITGVSNSGYFKLLRNESNHFISYEYIALRENNSEVENAENSNKSEVFTFFIKEPGNVTSDEETGGQKNVSEIENVENRNNSVEFPMFIISGASNFGTLSLYQNESIQLISYKDKGVPENNFEVENDENRNKREEFPIFMKESGNLTSDEETGHRKNISEIEHVENRNQSEESLAFIKESGNFTSDEDYLDRKNISQFENAENGNKSEEVPLSIWKTSKLRSDEYSGDHKNIYEIENVNRRNQTEESLAFINESGNLTSDEDTGDSRNISEIENVENRSQSAKSLTSIKDTKNFTSTEDVGVPKSPNPENVRRKTYHIHKTRKSNKTDEGMNALSKEDDDNSDESEEFLKYPINYRNLKPEEGFTKLFSILYGGSQKYKEKYWNPDNLQNNFYFDESIDDNKEILAIQNFHSQNRSEQQSPFDDENGDFTFDEDKNNSTVSNFGSLNQTDEHLPFDQNYSDFNFSETIFGRKNISSILNFAKYNLSDGGGSMIPNSENQNQSSGGLLFINENGDYVLMQGKNISVIQNYTNEGRNRSEYLLPLNMYRKLVRDGKVHHDESISKMLNIENHNQSKDYLSFVNEYGDMFDKDKNFSVIANFVIEIRNGSGNLSTIPNIVVETRNRSEQDVPHFNEHHKAFHDDDGMDDKDILEMLNIENHNESKEYLHLDNDYGDLISDDDRNISAIPNFVVENLNGSEKFPVYRNAVPDVGIQDDDSISEVMDWGNHNQSKGYLPFVNDSGDFIFDEDKNISAIPIFVAEKLNRSEKDVSQFQAHHKTLLDDGHLPSVNDSGNFIFHGDKNTSAIPNFIIENLNQSEEDMSQFNFFPDDEIQDEEDISEIMNFKNLNQSAGENLPFIDDYGDIIFFDGKNFSEVRDYVNENFNISGDYTFHFLDDVVMPAFSDVMKHEASIDLEHAKESLDAPKSDNSP